MMIEISKIRELFYYDNGLLIRKITTGNKGKKGAIVGCLNKNNYMVVGIKNKLYYVHRLIFAICNGYLPNYIDHIDGDKTNNNIENLRECSKSENAMNAKLPSTNTSGTKGVTFDKNKGKWKAQIMLNGKLHTIGRFNIKNDAIHAIKHARNNLHGEFSRG